MRNIALSSNFVKKLKKLKADKLKLLTAAMEKFQNEDDSSLRIHKLKGSLKNFWSFDIDYDLRVIYSVSKNGQFLIHLLRNFGTHKELYGT